MAPLAKHHLGLQTIIGATEMPENPYESNIICSTRSATLGRAKLVLSKVVRRLINICLLLVTLVLIYYITPLLLIPFALLVPGTLIFIMLGTLIVVLLSAVFIVNGIQFSERKRSAERAIANCPGCQRPNSVQTRKCPRCEKILAKIVSR